MEVEKKNRQRKKRTGAIVVSVLMLTLTVIVPMAVLFLVNRVDPIPVGVFWGYLLVSAPVAAAILVALAKRLKEIKGGEEDEAVKY